MPKTKTRAAVRDIKPQNKPTRNSFTVRHVQPEDAPTVEPLAEDQNDNNVHFHIEKVENTYPNQPEPSTMEEDFSADEPLEEAPAPQTDITPAVMRNIEEIPPKETIKVKFSKFVTLVANHDFTDVVNANPDEEIIISSNLLTELASGADRKGEKKIPLVFVIGIAIGVVLTYILFSTGK